MQLLPPLLAVLLLAPVLLVAQQQQQQQQQPSLHGSLVMVHDDESLQQSNDAAAKAQLSCRPVPIEVDMCKDMQYNQTASRLPGSIKQSEVAYVLRQFKELTMAPCAPFLKLFVCSMHLPLCNPDQRLLVRPCKEFCLRIRDLCSPLVQQFGHPWPQNLACDSLNYEVEHGEPGGGSGGGRSLCLRPSNREFEEALKNLQGSSYDAIPPQLPPLPPPPPLPPALDSGSGSAVTKTPLSSTKQPPRSSRCSQAEVSLVEGGAEISARFRRTSVCAPRCRADLMFSRADKDLATAWMLAWSTVCLIAAALAVATFALDGERFRFPERPIVWVAASHLVYAGGHLLRLWLGAETAGCAPGAMAGQPLHRVSRHAGHWCAVVFLLLYFASVASCLWWLLLTVCWYFCAARKWAHEALAQRSVWLHMLAWGAPLLLSVTLLVLHRVEADELTHLCTVDRSDRLNLLVFIVCPPALCLSTGLGFLASALCSSASVRHSLKWSGNDAFRRLEKLMIKIGLFSFLFVVPTGCVLAINVYEMLETDRWAASLDKVLSRPHCANSSGLLAAEDGSCSLESGPSSALSILKIFMSLAAGLPSGLFVWCNGKSLAAWRRCICRALACGGDGCCDGHRDGTAGGGSGRRNQPPLPPLPSTVALTAGDGLQQQKCKLQSLTSHRQQQQQQQQQSAAAAAAVAAYDRLLMMNTIGSSEL